MSWVQTLAGSWGVTVADHGGLLVAADDYHKRPSQVLKYSCDEGISWRNFTYTQTSMTVYGVITEPGEETTTVRYGFPLTFSLSLKGRGMDSRHFIFLSINVHCTHIQYAISPVFNTTFRRGLA